MSIVAKYMSLESLAATPLGEILDDMDELGAGQLAMTVKDKEECTVGGVIVLRGDHADRYMRAIEAVEREILADKTDIELRTERMFDHITDELHRARSKFPCNNHQLTAFNEEAGELNKAMLENNYGDVPGEDVYREAVQAAVTAIRVATEGDSTFTYDPAAVFAE